jgi:ATP-dependent Clp protease ATP-binding subunit ClpC
VAQVQAGVHELSPDQQELRRPVNGYNFTERVRKVLAMAREEAARLHHEYVAPQHMLLGLLREGEGVASVMIQNCGANLDELAGAVEAAAGKGKTSHEGGPDLPYTSRAKKVLELAMAEARDLNHRYVGTEHLLMGVIREGQSPATQALNDAGVTEEKARAAMIAILDDRPTTPFGKQPGDDVRISSASEPTERVEFVRVDPLFQNAPERLRRVFASAGTIAATLGAAELTSIHLALALLRHRDGAGNAALDLLHVNRDALIESLQRVASRDKAGEIPPEATLRMSNDVRGLMGILIHEQRTLGSPAPGTQHLLLALLRENSIAKAFAEQRVPVEKIREEVRRISG